MAADTMEALGVPRGSYVVKVNNRKLLDGVLETIDLGGEANAGKRLTVLRALDKYDRLGEGGVRALLGAGRKDESGDFTKGAGLNEDQIHEVMTLLASTPDVADSTTDLANWEVQDSDFVVSRLDPRTNQLATLVSSDPGTGGLPIVNLETIKKLRGHFSGSDKIEESLDELEQIANLVRAGKYGSRRIRIDPSVVRGLEYYTGPVFEVELLLDTKDEKGRPVRFGSVGGGGRYDGLVSRFRGEPVPATGFSIGVSRLQAALTLLGKLDAGQSFGPVIVTVFDKARLADYQTMVTTLRNARIRAELFLGNPKNMGAQFKYADKRNSPCVVIQGGDEKAKGEVQIKDLIEGAKAAAAIASNQEWRESRPAQFAVPEDKLVDAVREVLARHGVRWE
jgi:histidyl-tRNA synthetase